MEHAPVNSQEEDWQWINPATLGITRMMPRDCVLTIKINFGKLGFIMGEGLDQNRFNTYQSGRSFPSFRSLGQQLELHARSDIWDQVRAAEAGRRFRERGSCVEREWLSAMEIMIIVVTVAIRVGGRVWWERRKDGVKPPGAEVDTLRGLIKHAEALGEVEDLYLVTENPGETT